MEKVIKLAKSRTFWTLIVLFLLNGVEGVRESIPQEAYLPLNAILTAMGAYFRANPRL